ncbi:hypothetical protein [Streptomyces tropicalis]|uniref:Large membrane protein n=1 Tax=Streptomyces tropicalis TaxID=3034234 RepID=A0ABT6A002_9ACTN|nr:hypothetical protein [Streptomyces tropicalis]MDF3297170.1 hypothetical protein [Streptomyces tropicalis]
MNTERPENEDAAAGTAEGAAQERAASAPRAGHGAPEKAPAAPETDAAAPSGGEPGTEETRTARTQAGKPDAVGSADATTDEPDVAPDAGAKAAAGEARAARTQAENPLADKSHTEKSHAEEISVVGGPEDGERAGRPLRGRSPLAAVAVAAAVLLAGGGGAYLATSASGGGRADAAAPGGHGAPAPLVLDGYSAPGQGGTGGADAGGDGGGNGIAPGEPNPYGATYHLKGTLPQGPASAAAYWAKGDVTEDRVARLARALGVEGTPVAAAQEWTVGSGRDGSGPMLRVRRQAPGAWTFTRYAPGTDDCKGVLCTHDPAAPAVTPVSEAAAGKAAAPVLKALGQDRASVDAHQVMGAQRVVNADPVVGGLPTQGWSTTLTVGAQGEVVGGSGQLKEPVKGDTYPVLSARRTLDLMNGAPRTDHRMGVGGCTVPKPPKDRLEGPCRAPRNTRDDLTVDGAVFGLAARSSQGRQALVPSWLFRVRGQDGQEGFTVAYPAVDPRFLAGAAAPGQPAPSGSGAPATRTVAVTGYTTSGNDLTVAFEGGVCAAYTASARESGDRVTVTVTEKRQPGKVCILIAKEYQRTLHLDRPLGDRTVVGADGGRIAQGKAGARRPQTSSLAR